MNVVLRGKSKEIVETMVEEGYANSQSEAIRLAVIDFGQKHLVEEEEKKLVAKAVKIELDKVKAGKIKTKPFSKIKEKFKW